MSKLLKGTDDAAIVYGRRIRRIDENDLRQVLAPELAATAMTDGLREYFAQRIIRRLTALTGTRPKVADARALVAWSGEAKPAPEWCNKWVYIKNRNRYYNTESREELTRRQFNSANKGKRPKDAFDGREGVNGYVLANNFIKVADFYTYRPDKDDIMIKVGSGGLTACNTYDPATVPIASSEYTKEGLQAIERIKEHIGFIAGTPKRAKVLTRWLAHQVQRPGVIVGWSPLIANRAIDNEFLPKLLSGVLGCHNVGEQNATQVRIKKNNNWANEKAVLVFYELKGTGYYPQELVDDLAEYVRNDYITIKARGSRAVQRVPNTTNYLAFTRYFQHLPNGDSDNEKRWWVVSTTPESMEAYNVAIGDDPAQYQGSLNHATEWHRYEVRKWLLEYDIADGFYDLPSLNIMLNI